MDAIGSRIASAGSVAGRTRLWACVFGLWLLWHPWAWASGFQVLMVQTQRVEGRYWLDATLDYQFSQATLEALESGVPLTIELQVQVLRERGWLWDKRLVDLQRRYRLEYHALARQYLVTNQYTGQLRRFRDLSAARYFLGKIRRLPILEAVETDESLMGRLRARLDIEALPAPLRPVAYLSPDWRLVSEWYTWPL